MFNIEQLKEIQNEVISQMKVTELDSEGQKKSKVPYLQRLNAFFNGVHLVVDDTADWEKEFDAIDFGVRNKFPS